MSLRRISEHIHLSESYFSKIFKDDTGLSVVQYITLLRIQEAKKLLVYSQLTVNQISKTLGYNRTSYFCKIFKMATTETPHSYRKKYANQFMHNIIRTTRKTGGLLTGYKPVVLGQRLKALAFTTFSA